MATLNVLEFTGLIALGALAAGFLGSLTGLGGGVVIVPLLVLLKVDIHYAIGASLVSVIATSSGAAASYVKEGYSNIRIGMMLEIATTSGALTGAYLTTTKVVSGSAISILFGIVLIASACLSFHKRHRSGDGDKPDPLAVRLRLDSSFPTTEGRATYHVYRVP